MRGSIIRGAWLLAACVALLPASVRGQSPDDAPVQLFPVWPADASYAESEDDPSGPIPYLARGQAGGSPGYAPAHPQLPVPLGSTRPEDGGPYVFAQGLLYRQTNPLRSQPIAVRGFLVYDTSINGLPPGTFIGSGREALNVNNLNGQVGYQPGIELGAGWKFKDGTSLSVSWMNLATNKFSNAATGVPQRASVRPDLADSFITSFVFNFPPEFAGPLNKIQPQTVFTLVPPPNTQFIPNTLRVPSELVAYGIWNAATVMSIWFEQRFQKTDITYRVPIIDEEDYRFSATVGPRFAWIWERFKWRSTSYALDDAGNSITGPTDVAIYTNITSNRMYGVYTGCQTECYLGHGFSVMCDLQGAILINSVLERVKWERGDEDAAKKSKREWTVVPQVSATLALEWYPTEFIQVRFGYDVMAFFNTMASTRPIDFNYANMSPQWDHVNRFFDGFRGGVALWF